MKWIARVFLLVVVCIAVFADALAGTSPLAQGEDWQLWSPIRANPTDVRTAGRLEVLRGPSNEHLLGTDDRGRDVASRLVHGTRPTLVLAASCALLASFLAVALALLASIRPWADLALLGLCDIIAAVPVFLLVLLVQGLLDQSGLAVLVILISIPRGASAARLVRDSLQTSLSEPYCEAARALGCSRLRIVLRHALPASYSQILTAAGLTAATAVLAEVALSFLGLGLGGQAPSWGELLRQAHENQLLWWLLVPAGLASTALAWALGEVFAHSRTRM